MAKVTCEDCGREYEEGAPHSAFCVGTAERECEECGEEDVDCVACRDCRKVFCDECGVTIERKCYDCFEE